MPSLAELEATALGCTLCPLAQGRTNVVFGVGDPYADLMFVGEGPGQEEDIKGEPFVGRSGRLLDQLILEELGLTRESFYVANTVKCRPPGNRDPRPEEIASCRPFLDQQLELIDPQVVVTLGNFATKLLLSTTDGISRLRGRAYRFRRGWLVPTFHPSAALRSGGATVAQMRADLVRAKQLLEGAASDGGGGRATQLQPGAASNERGGRAMSEATTPLGGPGGAEPPRSL